ncbi:ATP-binding protein [Herbaspirillum sp. NPDC087042]|uniref:ATP-binding protein n=1 Tax=Herbaspirillum sp. NPDC087042 TaxID=3364004 RepID=UPI003815F6FB
MLTLLVVTVLAAGALLYRAGLNDWHNDLSVLSATLSESTAQTMSSAHLVLDSMQADIEKTGAEDQEQLRQRIATEQFSQLLREQIRGLPFVAGVGVSGADGKVIVISRAFPIPEIDMSDRDYYHFHRHSPSTEDFLGKTINARSNGQPTFFLTRRINDRHGNLLAIVVVGLRQASFDKFFSSINHEKPFSILLARKDDTVLVWSDPNKERHNIPPLPELHPPRPAGKEENAPYFFMQSHWLGIHQPVRGAPLYLEVAVTDEVYFSDWLESMYPLMTVAGISLLGLIGGFALTLRQVQRREQDALLAMQLKDAADQANEAKSRFLAMVSHEIRTPMNGIMGLSELLIESGLSTRQQHYANSIHGATEGLVRIINDILDISKIESGKLDLETMPFHPARLVREISELYRPSIQHKDVEFDVRIDCDEALVVLGDPSRLKQVLGNLLSNAIKFTQAGHVRLSMSVREDESDDHHWRLYFAISDSGIGISAEALDQLFQPFTQADSSIARRFGGTGLGLAISKNLVELMGGHIACRSVPGQSTKFSFDVPCREAPDTVPPEQPAPPAATGAAASTPVATPEAPAVSLAGARILVAEDTEINRQLLRILLARKGCILQEVENGAQAVQAARSGGYDLILMDCMMPIMDGYQATAEIRTHEQAQGLPRIPIIALTASAIEGDRQRCLDAGMDDYLSKPFTQVGLMSTVEKWLKKA